MSNTCALPPSLSCTHTSSLTPTLLELHASIPVLHPGWTDKSTTSPLQDIKLCKISCQPSSSSSLQPMFVSHSLTITSDLTWKAYISGHDVTSKTSTHNHHFELFLGSSIPSHSVHFCSYSTPLEYVRGIQRSNFSTCARREKGKFTSADGRVVAYEDAGCAI